MARTNMELMTEVLPIYRHEMSVETAGLINPVNTGSAANPIYLLDGEFITWDANNTWRREGLGTSATGGLVTGNPTVEHTVAKVPCFPVWAERGRTDTQAVQKIPVLMGGGPVMARFHSDVLNSADTWSASDVSTQVYCNWLSNGSDRNRRRGITKLAHANDKVFGKAIPLGWVHRVFTAPQNGFLIEVLLAQQS